MSENNIKCFSKEKIYNRFKLDLDLAELKKLETLDEKKTVFGLLTLYVTTAILIFFNKINLL